MSTQDELVEKMIDAYHQVEPNAEYARFQAMQAALAVAQQELKPQWRPISEAPKDGSEVLVGSQGCVELARWADGWHGGRWETAYRCADEGVITVDYPTRYMPLPEPLHE